MIGVNPVALVLGRKAVCNFRLILAAYKLLRFFLGATDGPGTTVSGRCTKLPVSRIQSRFVVECCSCAIDGGGAPAFVLSSIPTGGSR